MKVKDEKGNIYELEIIETKEEVKPQLPQSIFTPQPIGGYGIGIASERNKQCSCCKEMFSTLHQGLCLACYEHNHPVEKKIIYDHVPVPYPKPRPVPIHPFNPPYRIQSPIPIYTRDN